MTTKVHCRNAHYQVIIMTLYRSQLKFPDEQQKFPDVLCHVLFANSLLKRASRLKRILISWHELLPCHEKVRQTINYIFYFFPKYRIWHLMQIVFSGDNLHEMSNPIFRAKKSNCLLNLFSPMLSDLQWSSRYWLLNWWKALSVCFTCNSYNVKQNYRRRQSFSYYPTLHMGRLLIDEWNSKSYFIWKIVS